MSFLLSAAIRVLINLSLGLAEFQNFWYKALPSITRPVHPFKYNLKLLVYYEDFQYVNDAIKREKQLKNWYRQWKINLIEQENPN